MFKPLSRLFRSTFRSSSARRLLSEERRGHFFSWFNLQPDGEPKPAGRDACLSFRPSGPAFHALVRLDVVVRDGDRIVGTELWVDRRFIERTQSSFARDIVASFLGWALQDDDAEAKNALIANIGDMCAANEPVIMRADAAPPKPPADRTGGYAVFGGAREFATLALGSADLTLRNVTCDDRSRWLTIKTAMQVRRTGSRGGHPLR
jgi:hypothetical protein